MTQIKLLFGGIGSDERHTIEQLVELCATEFVPPLGSWGRSSQAEGLEDEADSESSLSAYVEKLCSQQFVLAYDSDTVVGYLSFRHGYATDQIKEYSPSNYAASMIVHPDYRRQGIARSMYQSLLEDLPSEFALPYVTTRTWAENDAHITLLKELGFSLVTRIPDDRGPGVDTVYYAQQISD